MNKPKYKKPLMIFCALCKSNRPAGAALTMPRELLAALASCCHLWIPGAADPVCKTCQDFYGGHLKTHNATATSYGRPISRPPPKRTNDQGGADA
jgi:hypothetical protein